MIIEIFIFMLGLAIGSFLNVCIYRLPREESIVKPGSHCPYCNKFIKWYDNIPVISFIILRGRCRYCKHKISIVYPVVELLSAFYLLYCYHIWGLSLNMVFFAIFGFCLIVAYFTDFATQIIPDQITLGLIVLGFIFSFFNPVLREFYNLHPVVESFLGASVGAGSVYVTGVIGKAIFKKEAMGLGDVKFMAGIGAYLGWKLVLLIYFIAPFFAIFYGVYRLLRYKDEYLPYGPFLVLATIFVIVFRQNIVNLIFFR